VADEDEALGADLLADGFEVGDISGERVVARVGQAR
jgi:hypothetical protein